MLRTHTRAHIGVQVEARKQGRVPIDMLTLKKLELCHNPRVTMNHSGVIHNLGQPAHLRVAHQRGKILRLNPRPSGFHFC